MSQNNLFNLYRRRLYHHHSQQYTDEARTPHIIMLNISIQ